MIDYSDDDDYDEGDDDDKDVDVKEYSAHLYSGSSLSTGARTMVVVRPPSCEIKPMTRWQLPFGGLASSLSDQFQHREKDHHLSPFRLKQVLCSLHVSVDVLRS